MQPISQNIPSHQRLLIIDKTPAVLLRYVNILDPDPAFLEQSAFFIRSEDYPPFELTTTTNVDLGIQYAEQALEQEKPFSVAFIDLEMPTGIRGFEAVQKLRAIDERIYIVLVTAYSDQLVEQLQTTLKRDIFLLRKPFLQEEVYQLAHNLSASWKKDRLLENKLSHSELEASYHAGVSEFRSHLLHNFGNALVNVLFYIEELRDFQTDISNLSQIIKSNQGKAQRNDEESRLSLDIILKGFEYLQDTYLGEALQSASNSLTHMSDILTIERARLQQGNPMVYTSFNVQEITLLTTKMFTDRLARSNIEFNYQYDEKLPVANLPKNLYQQLVLNLFKNSIEAIEERMLKQMEDHNISRNNLKGNIIIKLKALTKNEDFFIFSIEDDGIGFPKDLDKKQLFEPNFTLKKKGTGIGLHSVANFIQAIKGKLFVKDASEGSGALFEIYLPFNIKEDSR